MNSKIQGIAFFDIDLTILKTNSGEALIKQAYRKGLMSKMAILKAVFTGLQYKYGFRDTKKIINKMGLWLKGVSEEKFIKISDEIFQKDIIPNIRPKINHEIKRLKKQGTKVVILSSATESICLPLGEHLKVDDILCTKLEVKAGKFTGKPIGEFCFREEKLKQLKQFCSKQNFELKDVSYYADSIDDLPVLAKVGHPVCVTPDRKLSKVARKNDWLIHQW